MIPSSRLRKEKARHAEVLLVDFVVNHELEAARFHVFPSKKLCLNCHALLHILKENNIRITFGGASDVKPRKWLHPQRFDAIWRLFPRNDLYEMVFSHWCDEFQANPKITTINNRPEISSSVIMFDVPYLIEGCMKLLLKK